MARVCYVCQKGTSIGGHVARRGMARRKGGAGQKITGRSKRTFKPNVQKLRILNEKGAVITVFVCAKCIKAGKVKKA